MEQKGQQGYAQENPFAQEEFSSYSEDGVDLTLIRWMLSLTPTERLKVLQQNIRSVMRLRGARTGT
jgi:hypothetical protein